jgi:hypothetical protein
MTQPGAGRVLYVIVCGAGPAAGVGQLIGLAQDRGWAVQVIATPSALAFLDVPKLETQTGRPVRSQYRGPGEPKTPPADAIIVAPATYNTINKWAHGTSDTYALGILAEAPSLGIPVVVLPFVNSALAGRAPFKESVTTLRSEGVQILLGPGGVQPHPPGTGGDQATSFPWELALTRAAARTDPSQTPHPGARRRGHGRQHPTGRHPR